MALRLMWSFEPTAQTFGQIFVGGVCWENTVVYWLQHWGDFNLELVICFSQGNSVIKLDLGPDHQRETDRKKQGASVQRRRKVWKVVSVVFFFFYHTFYCHLRGHFSAQLLVVNSMFSGAGVRHFKHIELELYVSVVTVVKHECEVMIASVRPRL